MKKKKIQIAPSILSADFGNINKEIKAVEKYVDMIHIDVMDGQFVPNLTFGAPVLKKMKSKKPFDCHLMVEYPEKYIKDFYNAGAAAITIHLEAKGNTLKTLKRIKKTGMVVGIAIKPKTTVVKFTKEMAKYTDKIIIMTVEPGFGGQKFIKEMVKKIKFLKEKYPKIQIEVDGGINDKTAKECVKAGADILVAGNYIYKSKNYKKAIESLRV